MDSAIELYISKDFFIIILVNSCGCRLEVFKWVIWVFTEWTLEVTGAKNFLRKHGPVGVVRRREVALDGAGDYRPLVWPF